LTIDTNILYSLGGTDTNYLKLVVQTFVDNMGEVIAKMDKACADKNYDELMKTAHYAKSSLSVVKIDPMYEIMQQIEVQCKNKVELDNLPGKIKWLKEVYPKADSGLRKIFDIQTLAAVPTA
jgi:HPt (histidine-containing phosphotransfer) domain-containing protein